MEVTHLLYRYSMFRHDLCGQHQAVYQKLSKEVYIRKSIPAVFTLAVPFCWICYELVINHYEHYYLLCFYHTSYTATCFDH